MKYTLTFSEMDNIFHYERLLLEILTLYHVVRQIRDRIIFGKMRKFRIGLIIQIPTYRQRCLAGFQPPPLRPFSLLLPKDTGDPLLPMALELKANASKGLCYFDLL